MCRRVRAQILEIFGKNPVSLDNALILQNARSLLTRGVLDVVIKGDNFVRVVFGVVLGCFFVVAQVHFLVVVVVVLVVFLWFDVLVDDLLVFLGRESVGEVHPLFGE